MFCLSDVGVGKGEAKLAQALAAALIEASKMLGCNVVKKKSKYSWFPVNHYDLRLKVHAAQAVLAVRRHQRGVAMGHEKPELEWIVKEYISWPVYKWKFTPNFDGNPMPFLHESIPDTPDDLNWAKDFDVNDLNPPHDR